MSFPSVEVNQSNWRIREQIQGEHARLEMYRSYKGILSNTARFNQYWYLVG